MWASISVLPPTAKDACRDALSRQGEGYERGASGRQRNGEVVVHVIRQVVSHPRNACREPAGVGGIADQQHRAVAGIRWDGIEDVVDHEITILGQGDADQVGAAFNEGRDAAAEQGSEHRLSSGPADVVATAQDQPPPFGPECSRDADPGLEGANNPDLPGGLHTAHQVAIDDRGNVFSALTAGNRQHADTTPEAQQVVLSEGRGGQCAG
ncbi:hypothetical protein SA496_13445 [Pseudomonas sp. JS3066]|uniref:hypothetical protein n=1 Tax=Pseudomonas sp. JS3066 TaxID=3090665 RepID=UPI002E7C03FE|nr:hypothetical protein [Pseudomonas sp. JS3066]WVK96118.1 hypothetical protein SA496_13445 [Pseudomonas sp. JS3066]